MGRQAPRVRLLRTAYDLYQKHGYEGAVQAAHERVKHHGDFWWHVQHEINILHANNHPEAVKPPTPEERERLLQQRGDGRLQPDRNKITPAISRFGYDGTG